MKREEAEKLLARLKEGGLSEEDSEVALKRLKEDFPDLWEEYVLWKIFSEEEGGEFNWKKSLQERKRGRARFFILSLLLFLVFLLVFFYLFPPHLGYRPMRGFLPAPRSLFPAFLLALAFSLFLWER